MACKRSGFVGHTGQGQSGFAQDRQPFGHAGIWVSELAIDAVVVVLVSHPALLVQIIRSLGELAPYGMAVSVVAGCDAAAPPLAEATLPTAAAAYAEWAALHPEA